MSWRQRRSAAEYAVLSFDVSVWEFFWPLAVGARLVVVPRLRTTACRSGSPR